VVLRSLSRKALGGKNHAFVAGDKSELKPGARVIIFSATKKEDGTLEAARVHVGRDGITPPM
jgi:hypothetical protein